MSFDDDLREPWAVDSAHEFTTSMRGLLSTRHDPWHVANEGGDAPDGDGVRATSTLEQLLEP